MTSTVRAVTDLDGELGTQKAARKERDIKLATLEADIDEVNVGMKNTLKPMTSPTTNQTTKAGKHY